MAKVAVQKGKIQPDQKTSKTMTREEVTREDMANHDLRKSGQCLSNIKK